MQAAIQDTLRKRQFFKLICGASYRNTEFIRSLSQIYAAAGAHVIDVGARPELIQAARAGIQDAQVAGPQPLVMFSVGINQDVHFLRVEKDHARCDSHGFCANACPHEVFVGQQIRLENCLGCDHCVVACPEDALRLIPREPLADMQAVLSSCFAAGARALEIHTGNGQQQELAAIIDLLTPWQSHIDLLAFSLGAHGQSTAQIVALAQFISERCGPDIIIQADGQPISGRKGKRSSLASLELARELFAAKIPAFIQVSGGVNDLTGQLAQESQIPIHGVGMGSFARKYVGISPSQTLDAQDYQLAVKQAQQLVQSISKGEALAS